MRAGGGAAPTRMNLLRARRRLERVARGTALLRLKREALVREFFRRARPAVDARRAAGESARRASAALLRAIAAHGQPALRAMGWPASELTLDIRPDQVWGLATSTIVERPPVARTLAARGTAPGLTGPATVEAAAEFEALVDLLLDAAPKEMLMRRLGEALARTTRQVNMLERRIAPVLRADTTFILRALEEREREERLRLRRLARRAHAGRAPAGRTANSGGGRPESGTRLAHAMGGRRAADDSAEPDHDS